MTTEAIKARVAPEALGVSPVMRTWNGFSMEAIKARRRHSLDERVLEVVRLRCARYHDCRLCQSMRSVAAGFDDAIRSQIDDYENSHLPDAWKAALRLTDAVIISPASAGEHLRDDLHRHFSDEEIAVLIFNIMKWSNQKVLVALRVDAPFEGVTDSAFDEDGRWLVGAAAREFIEHSRHND